jgi:hypothetical protein
MPVFPADTPSTDRFIFQRCTLIAATVTFSGSATLEGFFQRCILDAATATSPCATSSIQANFFQCCVLDAATVTPKRVVSQCLFLRLSTLRLRRSYRYILFSKVVNTPVKSKICERVVFRDKLKVKEQCVLRICRTRIRIRFVRAVGGKNQSPRCSRKNPSPQIFPYWFLKFSTPIRRSHSGIARTVIFETL